MYIATNNRNLELIHIASGDLWAGAEVQLFHLVTNLNKKANLEVSVILLNHGQLEELLLSHGVNVTVYDESKLSSISIFKKIKAQLKQQKIDIIHSHRTKENILAGFVARALGIKSVRSVHGDSEFDYSMLDFRHKLISWLDGVSAKFFQHKIISVSDELTEKLRAKHANKLVTINNSVSAAYINARANETVVELAGKVNIGFVGRFVAVKRVELFIDMAKILLTDSQRQDIHFYLIGDGPLFETAKIKIKEEGLSKNIHLCGFVENSAPYIKALDYLVFTSKHEGLPMTLLEAMTLKTPVVTVDLPTISRILEKNIGGTLVEMPDASSLAKALCLHISNNGIEAQSRAALAYNKLMAEFEVGVAIDKYIDLYRSVLAK